MASRSSESPPYAPLREALRRLPPTGPGSFEELLAETLSGLTGRRFFLARAGSQQGRDLSTGGFGGTWIAVEAKRYGEQREFDERELLGELGQLCAGEPHPDLWVLAASSPIPEQLIATLRTTGHRSGIEVEYLDAPKDHPGALDFLCASDPATVTRILPEAVLPALQTLRCDSKFDANIRSLQQRFLGSTLGFDHVRKAAKAWFRSALSQPKEDRARLGQPLALLQPRARFVRRPAAERKLQTWLESWTQNPRPFVLLGEEGVGKSWASAAWAMCQAEGSLGTALLMVPSRDVKTTDPEALVAMCLERVVNERRDHGYWYRRVRSWCARSTEATPLFLLILDGINERPSYEWRDLFDRLNGNPWRERVAVVVTCRPGYWNETRLMPVQEPEPWSLPGFDDRELDEALESSGRTRQDFGPELLQLIRKPRYLALALKRYERLLDTGDFTIDRLLYEDWKDRLARKRSLTLTDDAFRAVLGELARKHKAGQSRFSQRDLEDLLPRDASVDLMEILTGGLLEIEGGLRRQLKIESRWLVHSLGLLLASELEQGTGRLEIEEHLAHFLEPHLELDQQTEILAAASLYALFTRDYSQKARLALLEAWVKRQNHSQSSYEMLKAYVPVAVSDYLDLLEDSTLRDALDERATERLEYSLLAWRSEALVEEALVARACRWLSLVHLEGFPYMRPTRTKGAGAVVESDRGRRRLRGEIETRAGCPLAVGKSIQLGPNWKLPVVDSDRFTWLCDSALFFLSALPARHRIQSLCHWAISRAIMGHPREWTEVAWLLRSAANEKSDGAVQESIVDLLAHPAAVVQRAGGEMLACLGTSWAAATRASLQPDLRQILPQREEDHDPCARWLRGWHPDDCSRCSQREDLTDLFVAGCLSRHALNPEFEIPAEATRRVSKALRTINPARVWGAFEVTSSQGDLGRIEPVVAVVDPHALAAKFRAVVRTQARDDEGWKALSTSLWQVHPLLNRRQERESLRRRWLTVQAGDPKEEKQLLYRECDLFAAVIATLPAEEQLELLLSRPSWSFDALDLLNVFSELDGSTLGALLDSLPHSRGKELERKLAFLLAQSTLQFTEKDEVFLCSLLKEPDPPTSEAPSRWLAIQTIFHSRSDRLWERALSGGNLDPNDLVLYRARWPERREFLAHQTVISYAVLRKVVDLATLGHLLAARGGGSDLTTYAEDIDKAIRQEKASARRWSQPLLRADFSVTCIKELVTTYPGSVKGWVDLVVAEDLGHRQVNFVKSTFPLYEALCEALFILRHPRATDLYRALRNATQQKDPIFRDQVGDCLPTLLFRIDEPTAEPLRKEWYQNCWGDMALLCYATTARRHLRESFLINLIKTGLRSTSCFEQAKAVSLAGWCGALPEVQLILEQFTVEPGSWLESLKEQAITRCQWEGWARFWYTEFLSSISLVRSFAAFRLFLRCVDQRYYAWGPEIMSSLSESGTRAQQRRRFLRVNQRQISKAVEKNEKDLNKYFLGLKIPGGRFAPWAGLPSRG